MGTCTRSERGATETAFAAPVTFVAGMFAGVDARQHAEVLVGGGAAQAVEPLRGRGAIRRADPRPRPPRGHLQRRPRAPPRPGAWWAPARAPVAATPAPAARRRGSRRSTWAWRPPAGATDPFVIPMPIVTATTTASTPIAVRARRAGERSGHCHSARYAADRPCGDRMGISPDRCARARPVDAVDGHAVDDLRLDRAGAAGTQRHGVRAAVDRAVVDDVGLVPAAACRPPRTPAPLGARGQGRTAGGGHQRGRGRSPRPPGPTA